MYFLARWRGLHPVGAWFLLAMFVGPPAAAEWTLVGSDHAVTAYFDPATIVKQGRTATMWSLLEHQTYRRLVDFSFASQTTRVEYDCDAPRSRQLSVSLYEAPKGLGERIYEDTSVREWTPIAPDTLEAQLATAACR